MANYLKLTFICIANLLYRFTRKINLFSVFFHLYYHKISPRVENIRIGSFCVVRKIIYALCFDKIFLL